MDYKHDTSKTESSSSKRQVDPSIIAAIISSATLLLTAIIALHGVKITSETNIEAAKISVYDAIASSGDLGRVLYKERSIFVGADSSMAIKAFPYADGIDSNTLGGGNNTEFVIDAAIENSYGNVWYRLASNEHYYSQSPSGQAYIYSGNVFFSRDASIIEWESNSIDGKN